MAKINSSIVLVSVMYPLIFLGLVGKAAADGQQPSLSVAATGSSQAGDDIFGDSLAYHTPLAGEPYHTIFMGEPVNIPARNRGDVTSLTVGGSYYTPRQGSTAFQPIGAGYILRDEEDWRTRDVISVFVNSLEYDRNLDPAHNLELVTLFENNTIPVAQKLTLNNQEINATSLKYGTILASIGPGLRYNVAPFQVDNNLRLQLLGRVGYFYDRRTGDTSPDYKLPPDTMLFGAKFRARYDGMRRNLLELPHTGFAGGLDIDYTDRNHWSDSGIPGVGERTQDQAQRYAMGSAYIVGVTGIPGLSEKNRVLASFHGGGMDKHSTDRFNAFTIGGGPLPSESDDLYRPDYPGTMFNDIYVSDYALTAVEYRRELTFFMYLHLRGSFIWAHQAEVSNTGQVVFAADRGQAATVGLDSGFFWNSEVYLDFSHDTGFIRFGKPGNSITFTWNKSL
ncbi:MAG TPA: hypothetical protein VLV32_03690 [Burkholderiales bacterium]|nr:hypothetical protein [Burkholderiales bacterium]